VRFFALASLALALVSTLATASHAASHREAPLTALDHKADITDFYAFVSYDDPSKVTLIMDVDPLLEPANGPNYFPFDPDIRYAIHIDNDFDAKRDIAFEFRFQSEIRLPASSQPLALLGDGNGRSSPINSPAPVPPGTPIIPPAITALDGAGSEGLGLRQTYTVTAIRGGEVDATRTLLSEGRTLYAVPTNVGPRTMPNYPALADKGIYDLGSGVKVWAGTADDPFYADLGAIFDTLNFNPLAFGTFIPGVLDASQDLLPDNSTADSVAGFNVNAIAIEVPIAMLTQDGKPHTVNDPLATIGIWATTARPKVKVYSNTPGDPALTSQNLIQIQRMGNPLINELIIGLGSKDKFGQSRPQDDDQFSSFILDPMLARYYNIYHDVNLPLPDAPRTDLELLIQYKPLIAAAGTPPGPVADLLRLNTGVPATAAVDRKRLGLLTLLDGNTSNDDRAGFPNGRRVSDDVVDVVARAVLGVFDSRFNSFPNTNFGDGVNSNDVPYRETFPYLGYAHSGRDSRHIDPGETGCSGTCP